VIIEAVVPVGPDYARETPLRLGIRLPYERVVGISETGLFVGNPRRRRGSLVERSWEPSPSENAYVSAHGSGTRPTFF
jgi:hypothetical protein